MKNSLKKPNLNNPRAEKENFSALYEYTSSRPFLLMLVGLPASGKSVLAEKIIKSDETNKTVILSSDKLREELYGDVDEQAHNAEVFNTIYARTYKSLMSGKNVIYDATNINHRRRKDFIERMKISCKKEGKSVDFYSVFVATEYSQCLRNNSVRERKVPESVIKSMYMSFNIPAFYEGWDKIFTYYPYYDNKEPSDIEIALEILKGKDISHDNPHHTYNIGQHCITACEKMQEYLEVVDFENPKTKEISSNDYFNACTSALYHDIGKPFCKTFTNKKGEPTEIAHYYCHENVSSYLSMFIFSKTYNTLITNSNLLFIATLIRWHMRPYVWEKYNSEKMESKDKKLWNIGYKENQIWNILELLHKADKNAH